jgi:hypothetical protein
VSNIVTDLLGKNVTVVRYVERGDHRYSYQGIVRAVAHTDDCGFSMLIEREEKDAKRVLTVVAMPGFGIEIAEDPAPSPVTDKFSGQFSEWDVFNIIGMSGGFTCMYESTSHGEMEKLRFRGYVFIDKADATTVRYALTSLGMEAAAFLRRHAQLGGLER